MPEYSQIPLRLVCNSGEDRGISPDGCIENEQDAFVASTFRFVTCVSELSERNHGFSMGFPGDAGGYLARARVAVR